MKALLYRSGDGGEAFLVTLDLSNVYGEREIKTSQDNRLDEQKEREKKRREYGEYEREHEYVLRVWVSVSSNQCPHVFSCRNSIGGTRTYEHELWVWVSVTNARTFFHA